jgi:hypothetical protein
MVLSSSPLLLTTFTTHSTSIVQARSGADTWWQWREGEGVENPFCCASPILISNIFLPLFKIWKYIGLGTLNFP